MPKPLIEVAVQKYLEQIKPRVENKGLLELHKAITYSLTSGGQRIRPKLSLLVAEVLDIPADKIMPFAVALELVHTYSLIHDDLPAMDDDDLRRGKPTSHKVFGEAMAILAGDALCTEPYRVIAEGYKTQPSVALELIEILATKSGIQGMVGGQAIDIFSKELSLDVKDLEFLHQCKTVALFEAAVAGPLAAGSIIGPRREAFMAFARALGLLFQIADDIKDGQSRDEKNSEASFLKAIGLEKARNYCQNLRDSAHKELDRLGVKTAQVTQLKSLVDYVFRKSEQP